MEFATDHVASQAFLAFARHIGAADVECIVVDKAAFVRVAPKDGVLEGMARPSGHRYCISFPFLLLMEVRIWLLYLAHGANST